MSAFGIGKAVGQLLSHLRPSKPGTVGHVGSEIGRRFPNEFPGLPRQQQPTHCFPDVNDFPGGVLNSTSAQRLPPGARNLVNTTGRK